MYRLDMVKQSGSVSVFVRLSCCLLSELMRSHRNSTLNKFHLKTNLFPLLTFVQFDYFSDSLIFFLQLIIVITWTSEWVITLWRSCELFLCRDISRVCSPYQKQFTWSPQMITMNLFLFLYHTTIDWILILMVYMYNLTSLLVKQQCHNLA